MKLTYIFAMGKHMQTTEYGTNSFHDLPTGQHKKIQIFEWLWLETVEAWFSVILCSFEIN